MIVVVWLSCVMSLLLSIFSWLVWELYNRLKLRSRNEIAKLKMENDNLRKGLVRDE